MSDVGVQVNGRTYALGDSAYVDDDGPITVRVSFPVAMDRVSVESAVRTEWARSGTTVVAQLRWTDDATLELVATRKLPFVVSPAGARSADKARAVDALGIAIVIPGEHEMSFYKSFELISGKASPRTHKVRFESAFSVSTDGKRVLVYTGSRQVAGPLPYILDLASGGRTAIALPIEESRFAYAGWLNDGRILLVGKKIWLAGPEGALPRPIADASPDATPVWVAAPSPLSRAVALWRPPETLSLVDLASGARRELDLRFHRCAADAGVGVAWAPNATLLAASDCPMEDLRGSTRVVDVATGREVRNVPVIGFDLALLPNGDLLALRPAAGCKAGCAGSESSVLLIDADGVVKRSYDAIAMFPAPGGAYLYVQLASQGAAVADMIELASDRSYRVELPGTAYGWTRQSELVVLR